MIPSAALNPSNGVYAICSVHPVKALLYSCLTPIIVPHGSLSFANDSSQIQAPEYHTIRSSS